MSIFHFTNDGTLAAADETVVVGPAAATRIVRFAPAVDVAPVGTDLVLRVQNVTGASPTGFLQATIPAGSKVATPVIGSFSIAANATIFVRVVSGPTAGNASSGLTGYFETEFAETGATFCSLSDLKSAAGVTVTTNDADLTLILQGVTSAMQRYMQRDLVNKAYLAEFHSIHTSYPKLFLNQYPIISVQAVRVNGEAFTDFVSIPAEGVLYNESGWVAGTYHVSVDYTAGYATVPGSLSQACIQQSRFAWSMHARGGNRFGQLSRSEAAGGSSTFDAGAWQPGVESAMQSFMRLA